MRAGSCLEISGTEKSTVPVCTLLYYITGCLSFSTRRSTDESESEHGGREVQHRSQPMPDVVAASLGRETTVSMGVGRVSVPLKQSLPQVTGSPNGDIVHLPDESAKMPCRQTRASPVRPSQPVASSPDLAVGPGTRVKAKYAPGGSKSADADRSRGPRISFKTVEDLRRDLARECGDPTDSLEQTDVSPVQSVRQKIREGLISRPTEEAPGTNLGRPAKSHGQPPTCEGEACASQSSSVSREAGQAARWGLEPNAGPLRMEATSSLRPTTANLTASPSEQLGENPPGGNDRVAYQVGNLINPPAPGIHHPEMSALALAHQSSRIEGGKDEEPRAEEDGCPAQPRSVREIKTGENSISIGKRDNNKTDDSEEEADQKYYLSHSVATVAAEYPRCSTVSKSSRRSSSPDWAELASSLSPHSQPDESRPGADNDDNRPHYGNEPPTPRGTPGGHQQDFSPFQQPALNALREDDTTSRVATRDAAAGKMLTFTSAPDNKMASRIAGHSASSDVLQPEEPESIARLQTLQAQMSEGPGVQEAHELLALPSSTVGGPAPSSGLGPDAEEMEEDEDVDDEDDTAENSSSKSGQYTLEDSLLRTEDEVSLAARDWSGTEESSPWADNEMTSPDEGTERRAAIRQGQMDRRDN